MALSDAEFRLLTRQIYRDLVLDTLGNLCLALGLYLVFSTHAALLPAGFHNPVIKALLIATGVINLRFLLVRFQRMRLWQQERQDRRKP